MKYESLEEFFFRAALGAEVGEKYCLKKGLFPKQASWPAHEGFSISRDSIIMHSYTGFYYRRRKESWSVLITRSQNNRIVHILFFYGTFQDVRNSDLLYPVGSSFDIGITMLEGKSRKNNDKS